MAPTEAISVHELHHFTGPHPQTKAWVGHCSFVVETALATQHWSGKSEGCAYIRQRAEHVIARVLRVCSKEKFLKLHTLRLHLKTFLRKYIATLCMDNSYISCTHITAI